MTDLYTGRLAIGPAAHVILAVARRPFPPPDLTVFFCEPTVFHFEPTLTCNQIVTTARVAFVVTLIQYP